MENMEREYTFFAHNINKAVIPHYWALICGVVFVEKGARRRREKKWQAITDLRKSTPFFGNLIT